MFKQLVHSFSPLSPKSQHSQKYLTSTRLRNIHDAWKIHKPFQLPDEAMDSGRSTLRRMVEDARATPGCVPISAKLSGHLCLGTRYIATYHTTLTYCILYLGMFQVKITWDSCKYDWMGPEIDKDFFVSISNRNQTFQYK